MFEMECDLRVLTFCRESQSNSDIHGYPIAEFIFEQNKALESLGVNFDYYLIRKGGFRGYLKEVYNFRLYLKKKLFDYDIVHAHGGHIGVLANSQRRIPVITTYHGSDLNNPINRLISLNAVKYSKENIFVSKELLSKVKNVFNNNVIPCGVDFDIFQPVDKVKCRNEIGFDTNEKIILFAGQRERKEKNYELAKEAADVANIHNLFELKGYVRKEVNLLLNACDLLLLTSISEGSPQVIKEAMACNCPIVATDVGDIGQIISDTEGCFITSFDPVDVAKKIKLALQFNKRTNGRELIKHLDNQVIAKKILETYQKAIRK